MPRTHSRDLSGFGVFSHGDAGEAHVMAHRMLDDERHELGHRLLAEVRPAHVRTMLETASTNPSSSGR